MFSQIDIELLVVFILAIRLPPRQNPSELHNRQLAEFYCLDCCAPKQPAEYMADYYPRTALRGSLSGIS